MTDAERAELQQWRDDAHTMRQLQASAMWEVYSKHLTYAMEDAMTRMMSERAGNHAEIIHWRAVADATKKCMETPQRVIAEAEEFEQYSKR